MAAATKRAHGKASLDPTEYAFVFAGDNDIAVAISKGIPFGTYGAALARWSLEVQAAREELARRQAQVAPNSIHKCTHCGVQIRYYVIWKHIPTGQHIVTGEQCAEERMALESRAALDLSLARKAAAAQAAQAKLTAAAHKWIEANADLWAQMLEARGDRFVADMIAAVGKYGSLTERQAAALPGVFAKLAEWTTPGAVCELRQYVEAPEGKAITVEGTVTRAEFREDGYGGRFVMTVKADGGWMAWGTVPTSLLLGDTHIDDLQGARVRFVADLTRGGKGDMAFTKRPRQAVLLTEAAA